MARTADSVSRSTKARAPRADHVASIVEMRRLIEPCFQRRPWIYYTDLFLTVTIGYGCAATYLAYGLASPLGIAAFAIAGLALFRAGTFIHEIAHLGHGTMRGFKVTWNLLCGIPMLMPSFLYDCHIDHHNVRHYGTRDDGEYLPLGSGTWRHLLLVYWPQVLVLPALAVVRFAIIGPLSFLRPSWRRWTLERASSYVINPWYRRELPPAAPRGWWAALDLATSLRVWAMFAVVLLGLYPPMRLALLYLMGVYVIGLNYTRNMTAHHYRNEGEPMGYADQLDDSITIAGHPLWTELLFPLGLRS